MSTSRLKWLRRDSTPTVSLPAGRFEVEFWGCVLVLELGFGVNISEEGFTWLVLWQSALNVGGYSARACISEGTV